MYTSRLFTQKHVQGYDKVRDKMHRQKYFHFSEKCRNISSILFFTHMMTYVKKKYVY